MMNYYFSRVKLTEITSLFEISILLVYHAGKIRVNNISVNKRIGLRGISLCLNVDVV